MTRLQVLTAAVKAAVASGCDRKAISVPHWAASYRVTTKQVRDAWEAQLTRLPPNTDSPMEGK